MEHNGSRETFDFIADWIAPTFPYSKKDVWHRMGMIGVFGHYVLSCTQGDILEIGVGESSIYLTALSKIYGRRIYHCDIAESKIVNPITIPGYLSEGVSLVHERDTAWAFGNAMAYAGSSDSFFQKIIFTPIALAFIDGDHIYEQAKKDLENVYPLLVDNGYVLLHDTYPPSADYLTESTCGGVYRLRQDLEKDERFDCITLPKGTAMSVGITIARKKPADLPEYQR